MLKKTIGQILSSPPGSSATVYGWVRSLRRSKNVAFIHITDGSCTAGLQAVVADPSLLDQVDTGAALKVEGQLQASPGSGQAVELVATDLTLLGPSPPASYPLQKKKHSFEFLRTIEHLRGRSNSISAVMRMRSCLSAAIHHFFQQRGFFYLHTPIVTYSDAEGGGDCFEVHAPSLHADRPFFGRSAYLTVSGQLEGEAYAQALGRIYTFGPTFRAENSHTTRHLAEFWMVEPELAFCDFTELQDLAIDMIRSITAEVVDRCPDEIALFDRWVEPGLHGKLTQLLEAQWQRVSYRQVLEVLAKSKQQFSYQPGWDKQGLQTEHERFLTEEVFQGPVLVYDYPAEGKAFYMKQNDDETVAGMDLLLPRLGEIIGGSMREDNYHKLEARMRQLRIERDDYQWYLDLRRFGSAPHGGFGLGLERLLMYLSGMKNIRDVIPFPRAPA